jgi:hypothetical protein
MIIFKFSQIRKKLLNSRNLEKIDIFTGAITLQRHNKGHALSVFFELLIQTSVFIAQNDRIDLDKNKTKTKFDSDHFLKKKSSKTLEIIRSQKNKFLIKF